MSLADELVGALDEMSAREVRKKLRKAGCREVRQKGSHVQVKCPPNRQSTVPAHGKKDIKKGTLKGIEKSLQIDLDGDGRPKSESTSAHLTLASSMAKVWKSLGRLGCRTPDS